MTEVTSKYTEALREADDTYRRRQALTKEQKIEAVRSLAERGVFSNKHLSLITGLNVHVVGDYTRKTKQTGGTFHPRAIPALLEVIDLRNRSEKDIFAVLRALQAGCGVRMMSRLTGMAETTIKRQADQAAELRPEMVDAAEEFDEADL